MPATEAQVAANRANALKSTGPKTPEGKEASKGNALKHGLTATKVLPERESIELSRRYMAYCEDLQPSDEVGMAYVLRAAVCSVRMERAVLHENAVLADRARRAEADFVPPEGVDEATAAALRAEAGNRALFDDSKAAVLARKYEASAERGFFKALKELRSHERAIKAAEEAAIDAKLASILPSKAPAQEFADLDSDLDAEFGPIAPGTPADRVAPVDFARFGGRTDVPFTIGKPR